MKISIDELRSLPQQRVNLSFKESIADLDTVKPVLGDLTLFAQPSGIRLFGQVQTLLKLTCHRCLGPYFLNLSVPLEECFLEERPVSDPSIHQPKERELTAADFVEYLPEDGILDITDIVYQAVTLAIPATSLCGEECPGPAFPSPAGGNSSLVIDKEVETTTDRIDPRWKNLKSLFPKHDTDTKS